MAAKVSFDYNNRIIEIIESPTGDSSSVAEPTVEIDVQVDIYSDGKEDWYAGGILNGFKFPVRTVGGDSIPGGRQLGITYFLQHGWRIRPYEADHRLIVDGNLYTEEGDSPFVQTAGSYNVMLELTVSNLIDLIVSGSGVTEQDKTDIINGVWGHTDSEFLLKSLKNKKALVKTGSVWELIIYDDDNVTPMLQKDLKDKDGNDITDLAAGTLAQELRSDV